MSKTILVVEDEGIVAKDLQSRLKKIGYHVPVIVSSGEEAILKIAEVQPDLVLMDIQLKGKIDGIEAAEHIYFQYNIPIIYLTAYADDRTLERARLTDPFGYLLKPFKEKELQTSIEIAFSKHKQQKQLEENQVRFLTAIKSIGEGVITCSEQGLITFMNPVAEKITGWKQNEAYHQQLATVFQIVNKKVQNVLEIPVNTENILCLQKEATLFSKTGIEVPVEYFVTSIENKKNNNIGVILVFRDITERQISLEACQKQLEQEHLLSKLIEISQKKDDFLSTVSHELRAPLSNMKMAIQLLQNKPLAEQGQQYLNILKAECDREMDLINDLLDLHRTEAGNTHLLNPEVLDLHYWLPNIIESYATRIQEYEQILQVNIPTDIPPLISDSAYLTRILGELLNNACKYTAPGGEISLSVHYEGDKEKQDGEVKRHVLAEVLSSERNGLKWRDEENVISSESLQVYPSNSYSIKPSTSQLISTPCTTITIRNSTEIPDTALPRIFDKFYRFRSPAFKKQPGSGLGLALVQKLVEQLQGSIEVNSSDGWTTFTLKLTNLVIKVL